MPITAHIGRLEGMKMIENRVHAHFDDLVASAIVYVNEKGGIEVEFTQLGDTHPETRKLQLAQVYEALRRYMGAFPP